MRKASFADLRPVAPANLSLASSGTSSLADSSASNPLLSSTNTAFGLSHSGGNSSSSGSSMGGKPLSEVLSAMHDSDEIPTALLLQSSENVALRPSGVLKRRDSGFLSRLPSMGPQVPLHRQNSEKQIPSSSSGSGARSAQSHHGSSFSHSSSKPSLLEPTPQKLLKMNHNPYTPPTTHDSSAGPVSATSRGMTIPAGVTVARYLADFQTEAGLGKGSFGRVDLARHRVDGWSYAIKRMKYRPSHNKEALDTVLNEIFMLASLSHPHIVRYHGSWVEENADSGEEREVFIQTEFCYGGSLSKWWPQWLASAGVDTVLASAARHRQQMAQHQHAAAANGKPKTGMPRPSPGGFSQSFSPDHTSSNQSSHSRPHPTLTPRPTPKNGIARPMPTPLRSQPNHSTTGNGSYHSGSGSVAAAFGFGPQVPDEATVASAVLKVEAKICEILRHVCKALVYMHDEKHVVHLDVKPDNIFVQQETLNLETAIFKIGDCGSMRKIPSTGGTDSLNSSIGEKLDGGISLSPRGLPLDDLAMDTAGSSMDASDMDVGLSLRARGGLSTPPPPLRHTPTPPATGAASHATPNSLFPTFTSNVPATPLVKGGRRLESIASVPTTPLLPTNKSLTGSTGSNPSSTYQRAGANTFAMTPAMNMDSPSGIATTPIIVVPPHMVQNNISATTGMNGTAMIDGDDIDGDGRYLAPELLEFTVLLNDQLPKADMYALGCSIVELAHVALQGDMERLSAPFKQLLTSLMDSSPQLRPSAAQVLGFDLLQPPEVLHLRRELKRLEEKVFELERQRAASSTPRYDWQSPAGETFASTPRDGAYSSEMDAGKIGFAVPSSAFGQSGSHWHQASSQHDTSPQEQYGQANTQTTPGRNGLNFAPITPTGSATSSPGYTSPTFALKSSNALPRFGAPQPQAHSSLLSSAEHWKSPSGFASTSGRVPWRMDENTHNKA